MLSLLLQRSVNAVPWKLRLAIRHLPLVAPFQRWLVSRVLDNRTFMHNVNRGPASGLQYPVCLPADKAIWSGTYESSLAVRLAASVKPGDVCYDVGSYRGFFAGVLALAGASRVYAFEPLPSNCRQVEAMIAANPQLPLVLLPVALGNEPGRMTFQVMGESSMGKLASSQFQADRTATATETVEVRAIDELVGTGSIAPPDVIKIDVEGAEMMVLTGARRVLARHQPRLFIEVHSRALALECHRELASHGYSVQVIETGAPPDPPSDPALCHFDCVFNRAAPLETRTS